MLEPFRYAFVQRGVVELLLLAVCAGLLGSSSSFAGSRSSRTRPARRRSPVSCSPTGSASAPCSAAWPRRSLFAAGVEWAHGADGSLRQPDGARARGRARARRDPRERRLPFRLERRDAPVRQPAPVSDQDLVLAAAAGAAALCRRLLLGRRWLALGFDAGYANAVGLRSPLPDALLLVLIALSATVSLAAVGALLVTALFVVPAATVRLLTRRLLPLQLATVGLVAVEGVVGIWFSVEWNVPPGAAIAVLSGGCSQRSPRSGRWRGVARCSCPGSLCSRSSPPAAARSPAAEELVRCRRRRDDHADRRLGAGRRRRRGRRASAPPAEQRPARLRATPGRRRRRRPSADVVLENGDELDGWMDRWSTRPAAIQPSSCSAGTCRSSAGRDGGPEASRRALVARPAQRDLGG